MFQLSLLPALVAPTFAPLLAPTDHAAPAPLSCAAELSRALSNDAVGVLLVGDVDAQLLGDAAGQWARFMRDERWLELLTTAAESEGEDAAAVRQGLDAARAAMQGMRGAAFAADASGGAIRGVMSVDDTWFQRASERVRGLDAEIKETTCLGRPALTGPIEGEGGTMLLVDGGAYAFLALDPDGEAAIATVGALIAGLEAAAEDTTERWWLASDARVADASLELFMDLGALMPAGDLEEMTATLGAPGVVYGAVMLGAGSSAEVRMSVDFDGGPVMDAFASSLVKADTALFGFVPAGYTGSIIGLDVLAAIEEALAFAEQTTPGASTDYDQGLEALAGVLGVDLEADLLAHLTGQLLLLQPDTDYAAIAELGEGPAAIEALLPVLGFGIGDVDAVVGVLEALAEAAAAQGLVAETAEIAGGSLWTFDPGVGMTIAVAAGSGFLAIGTEQGVVDLLAQATKPSEERALARKELAAVVGELDGCLVTAATMATVLESLDSLQGLIATVAEGDEEAAAAGEIMTTVAAIAGDHLSGVMAGELEFTAKRVAYRMLAR